MHFVVELLFPLRVGMRLHRIIPGIDMPTARLSLARLRVGLMKQAAHVHQFAEGKVCGQRADHEQMRKKKGTERLRRGGSECDETQRKLLDAENVGAHEIAHQHAGNCDAEQQEQRKIV